jgi:Flp pilus assembly pilin Flp
MFTDLQLHAKERLARFINCEHGLTLGESAIAAGLITLIVAITFAVLGTKFGTIPMAVFTSS